ncbi:MAG: sulfatase-like hydrolase/transferase, partial [bacterium]
TIVVITADHGEMFGEHGLYGHGNSLYRSVLQVPLLIIYPPSVPVGFKVTQSVSLRDIPSTILDLAGREGDHPIPGASLSRYWGEPGATELGADVILSELAAPCRIPPDHGRSPVAAGQMKAVLQNGKMYIKNYGSGREELYDYELDRDEQADLAQSMESEEILCDMRRYLDENTRESVR